MTLHNKNNEATGANQYQYVLSKVLPNKISLLQRYQICKPIFESLKDIPYAVIKGAVLSYMAYGNSAERFSGDIDILVNRIDLDKVKTIMKKNGFSQGYIVDGKIHPFSRKEIVYQSAVTHQIAPFIKETGSKLSPFVEVDFNTGVFWGEIQQNDKTADFLRHTEPIHILGVNIFKLSSIYEFIAVCLHHYKDLNSLYVLSNQTWNQKHFQDILGYLQRNKPSIEFLVEIGCELNVIDYLYFCVYYTYQFFGAPDLVPYLIELNAIKTKDLTGYCGLNDMERLPWHFSFEERLYDPSFPNRFFQSLPTAFQKKVQNNRQYMQKT